MKKLAFVALFVLAISGLMMAQTWTSPVDVLGAHQNQGRGCAGCHAPHSGSFGSGHGGATDAGNYALWGQDASPLYGKTIAFGDNGRYVEVLPSGLTVGGSEVSGILLCLSCHDGNLTQSNMMQNWSYEQQIGLLTNTTYGSQKIPTLLGNDGTTAGNYFNDHPVGVNATISASTANGLVWSTNKFTVTAGSNYAQFIAAYGAPVLRINRSFSNINAAGQPYVTCRTCHNQHVMTVFTASTNSPIAGNTSGYYATYFFVAAPYNPNLQGKLTSGQAASTTQFCRQCHFGEANEANNTFTIPTVFQ
jgi:cytochrome c553